MKSRPNFLIASAAALLLGTAMTASADIGKRYTVDSVTVSVAELNLTQEADQATAYKRLKKAATEVCGSTFVRDAGSLIQAQDNRACFNESLSAAVDSLGNEAIKELHNRS